MTTISKSILLVVSTLAIGASAFARPGDRGGDRQRVVIDLDDQHFRGHDNRIMLKREIKNLYPNMNLRRYELKGVRLVAKSKRGQGTAELLVAGRMQDSSRIYGTPRDFNDHSPGSFDRIQLRNYEDRQGPWQIALNGNIKVRKVVAQLEFMGRNDGGGRVSEVSLGEFQVNKFSNDSKTYEPQARRVSEVLLYGNKSKVKVKEVVVEYFNGDRERLTELEGTIKSGNRKVAFIGGRNILRIHVVAISPSPFGSRGRIEIKLRQRGRR